MKLLKVISGIIVLAFTMMLGCSDLSVDNLNQPDAERALASDTDVKSLAEGQFRLWYNYNNSYNGPAPYLSVAADAGTASWGNFGMQDAGKEPRIAFDNSPSYTYIAITNLFFDRMYSINSAATDVLKAIESGVDFENDEPMVMALAKLAQGLSMSSVSLVFDQGYIIDENSTDDEIADPEFKTYSEIADYAVSKLEDVVEISNNNSFTLTDGVMRTGMSITNVELAQIANSFIARTLSNLPRNAVQNNQVDWTKVKNHAQNGLDFDFGMIGDGWNQWIDNASVYLVYPGWARVDHYVINMMDNSYPAHNPNGEDYPAPDPDNVIDQRLLTDYQHLTSNSFNEDRGLYYFSSFRYSRYDDFIPTWDSWQPEFLKAENDLYLAEAHMHLGEYGPAADVINNGPRVTRGDMDPVGANENEILDAIHHERMVEIYLAGMGNQFFNMRKQDLLQEGTPLHFPVPAQTLEILGMQRPFYTFGGVSNADGETTSNGGWR